MNKLIVFLLFSLSATCATVKGTFPKQQRSLQQQELEQIYGADFLEELQSLSNAELPHDDAVLVLRHLLNKYEFSTVETRNLLLFDGLGDLDLASLLETFT